jgi:hypothetical protein
MWFFLATFLFTQVARRVGWWASRRILYIGSTPMVAISCVMWGGTVALSMHVLVAWLNPHWLVKWIFGYAQGAYAAVPNFGLIAESSVPPGATFRHQMISTLPLLSFIVHAVALALLHAA